MSEFDEYDDELPPPAPPMPRLNRALSRACPVSCSTVNSDGHAAIIIFSAQTDLPATASETITVADVKYRDSMQLRLLDGDLPVAKYNGELATIDLPLPANTAPEERISIRYTIDDNTKLSVELNYRDRTCPLVIEFTNSDRGRHLFVMLDSLLTTLRGRINPEETRQLEQRRLSIEDLGAQYHRAFARLKSTPDGDTSGLKRLFERMDESAHELQSEMWGLKAQYE